ncbi:MAG: S-layer homology domain-containing protein [Clostridiales bacterium]
MKKITSIIFLAILVIQIFSFSSMAIDNKNYVAIGDSITYGMSASSDMSYVNKFYKYLYTNGNYNLKNIAVPGHTGSSLLNLLTTDNAYINDIKAADIITITIGGNDILSPTIDFGANYYDIDPYSESLGKAVFSKMSENPIETIQLLNSEEFKDTVTKSLEEFKYTWTNIVAKIKDLAPNAQIYVFTSYNPCLTSDPVFNMIDQYFKKLNEILLSENKNITIVDIYEDFINNEDNNLVKFNISTGNVDIHPLDNGHELMYKSLLNTYLDSNITLKFTDLKNHWCKDNIKKLYDDKIVNGYSNNKFRPNAGITRAEAITIIAKILNLKSEKTISFDDDKSFPTWAKDYIYSAVSKGIIKGYEDNTFKPEKIITRAELSVIIVRSIDDKIYSEEKTNFTDDNKIPIWAKGYIKKAFDDKIISGYPDNSFMPYKQATRAELCTLALKIKNLID